MPDHLVTATQGGADELTGLVGWLTEVITALGPLGVAVVVALENLFPPIPSEIVLPFAGFVAGRGGSGVWTMVIASIAGSVGGAVLLYELGRRIGQQRARNLLCRLPLVEAAEVDAAADWFGRHDNRAVLTGRFVPGVRSLVSLPAGANQMPRARFVLVSALGTAVWNTTWVWAGYLLGSRWRDVARYSDRLDAVLWAAIIALLIRFVWKRRDRLTARS